jgi:drug/metabolite transporter (DMT)-like permease
VQRHPDLDTTAPITPTKTGRARLMLLVSVIFWGISFPLQKALALVQHRISPASASFFLVNTFLLVRMGAAALIIAASQWRILLTISRTEWNQGLGMGFMLSGALLAQVLGLHTTDASISAFLTQTGVVMIPSIVAIRDRHWPRTLIFFASALVIIGTAFLTLSEKNEFRFGTGELLTVIGAVIFSAQVVWLERPLYKNNRPVLAVLVTLSTASVIFALVALFEIGNPASSWNTMTSLDTWVFMSPQILLCTVIPYILMYRWQSELPASEAGIIYSLESVVAVAVALFFPALFSIIAHIHYANEVFTWHLLLGGGLIIAANLIVALKPQPRSGNGIAG